VEVGVPVTVAVWVDVGVGEGSSEATHIRTCVTRISREPTAGTPSFVPPPQ
jgi:hypothetical protein